MPTFDATAPFRRAFAANAVNPPRSVEMEFHRAVSMGAFQHFSALVGVVDPFWHDPRHFEHTSFELAIRMNDSDYGKFVLLMLDAPRFQDAVRDPRMDHLLALCAVRNPASESFLRLLPYFSGERANAPFCATDLGFGELSRVAKTRPNALMLAARQASAEAVSALLAAGADPARIDGDNCTALMYAAASGFSDTQAIRDVVRLLLLGSNPGLRDHSGYTAFLHAADAGNLAAVEALLPFSDPLDETNEGHDAWGLVSQRGWGILDILSGFVPPERADAALNRGGPEQMPIHAARVESRALLSAVSEAAASLDEAARNERLLVPARRRAKSL